MPFDPNQPYEVVPPEEPQEEAPAFDPDQPFEVVAADPEVAKRKLINAAVVNLTADSLKGPEGMAARYLLRKGGKLGDVAVSVVPAIGGAIVGSAAGPAGTLAGGGAGAIVGDALKQAREMARGDRADVGYGELAVSGATGALPVGKVKPAATILKTAGNALAKRATQGGVIAGAGETVRQIADEDEISLGEIAKTTAMGAGVGAVMGAGEGALVGRHAAKQLAVEAGEVPGAMKAAMEESGVLPKAVDAAPPPSLPDGPGVPQVDGNKPLGLIESAKASPQIKPELKQGIAGFYEPKTNAESLAEATRRIDASGSLDAAKAELLLNQSPDAVSNAMGLELVRKFQIENRLGDAADVLYDMSLKAKTQGQAIQILSTLSKETPEGMAAYAQRLFGRKLTEDELKDIATDVARVSNAKSPEVKLARQAEMLDKLHQGSGGSAWDQKAAAAMNMAMLLNPKTIIRNIGGNTLMASTELGSDIIAPAVDAGVSVFTGKRTVSGPQMVEYFKGLMQPARDVKLGYQQARSEGVSRAGSFKEGIKVMSTLGKLVSTEKTEVGDIMNAYRTTFSNPLMKNMEKTMGAVMGGPDRAFYVGRLRSSLANQMKAAGIDVPTADMLDQASIEAARSIYQDRNFISTGLREARGTLNSMSTLGRSRRFGLGQALTPFVQVPGALLARGLEYSPAGFLKSLSQTVGPMLSSKRAFNQREFSQSFSKALAGTAGLAGTGYMLGKLNIITGAPDPDPKVRNLQRSLGHGAYQINVSALKRAFQSLDWKTPQENHPGDVFVNYDWAQPMSFPVAMGADYEASRRRASRDEMEGKVTRHTSQVVGALLSAGRTIEEQPMLTGLTGFMSDAANASRGDGAGILEAMYESMLKLPGQYNPTVVRQITQLMDNRVYETRGSNALETAYKQVAANIPGVAESIGLKPRADLLGDLAERYQANGNSYFNVLVNPAFVTRMKDDPELRELSRIWEQTGETRQIPGRMDSKITINGQPKVLTANERADYQQFVGRLSRDAFQQLMRTEGYQNATDEQRAKVLGQFVSGANVAAKILLFGNRPKNLTKFDRAMLGVADPAKAEEKP